jgi:hypothetical protein
MVSIINAGKHGSEMLLDPKFACSRLTPSQPAFTNVRRTEHGQGRQQARFAGSQCGHECGMGDDLQPDNLTDGGWVRRLIGCKRSVDRPPTSQLWVFVDDIGHINNGTWP